MSFVNFSFWGLFLPIVAVIYFALPKYQQQNAFLLLASLVFYSFFDYKYIVLLGYSVAVTFFGGKYLSRLLQQSKESLGKFVLVLSLVLNFAPLIFFKYIGFFSDNINLLCSWAGFSLRIPRFVFPVGLSFFIFQSTTYLLDLYYGKTTPEKSLVTYSLFVSFFPTIISGPIQRSFRLLPAFRERRTVSWDRMQSAFLIFLWGMFVKMVVADRLAVFTEETFTNFSQYGFWMLSLSIAAYSIQIYADFYGYSLMAAAVARLLGFDLPDNFCQPYMAASVAEFWRRWHISLSSWFRDYIYIPLGGSRKGTWRKYANLTLVFLISGIWHGSTWNFVIWGGLHAVYQILGYVTKSGREAALKKLGIRQDAFSYRLWKRLYVGAAVGIAWVFFRLTVQDACGFLTAMFTGWDLESFFLQMPKQLGLDGITVFAVLLFSMVSVLREHGYTCQSVLRQNLAFRLMCYFFLILFILLWGCYGPAFSSSAFIYMDF